MNYLQAVDQLFHLNLHFNPHNSQNKHINRYSFYNSHYWPSHEPIISEDESFLFENFRLASLRSLTKRAIGNILLPHRFTDCQEEITVKFILQIIRFTVFENLTVFFPHSDLSVKQQRRCYKTSRVYHTLYSVYLLSQQSLEGQAGQA